MRKFTGTDSGPSACRAYPASRMSSSVSPMPKRTPEQGESPASFARVTVAQRSANACVEQMSP